MNPLAMQAGGTEKQFGPNRIKTRSVVDRRGYYYIVPNRGRRLFADASQMPTQVTTRLTSDKAN